MIKVSKYVYIHPLTIVMFISAYITRSLELMSMLYLVMFLHEMAHMLSAVYLKLGVSRIIFYPFGVNLTLKTHILCSFSDKIILYLSGPFVNISLAVIMLISGRVNDFYYNNFALFILNILPMLPLDGGRVLEEFLLYKRGEKYTRHMMVVLTIILSAILTTFLTVFSAPTINSFTFAVFILGGAIMNKPKYRRDYLRQLALDMPKTKIANVIITEDDLTEGERLIGEFSASKRTIVVLCDKEGKIENIKTDKEIIQNILA